MAAEVVRMTRSRARKFEAATKAAALRINLNVEGCGIVAAPVHAPSRGLLLFPLLLSHTIPLPRVHKCVMAIVHSGFGSFSRSTCPPLSPSPHANSFVIGTAVINTHTRRPQDRERPSAEARERGAAAPWARVGRATANSYPKPNPKPKP